MALANGLAIVPEELQIAKKGQIVQAMMLDWKIDS
jgi:hypothetical protein